MEFTNITTPDSRIVQIDHSLGRVQRLNGDLFYSPNSKRDVVIPEYEDPDRLVFVLREVRLGHFLKPRWQTRRTGYLSFLTLRPINTGYPFDRLAGMPVPHLVDGTYLLDEERSASWSRLEQDLIWATACLRTASQFFTDRPFAPWAFGYDRPAPFRRSLKIRAQLSRDWFQVWISLLSFLIAISNKNQEDAIPTWYKILEDRGFEESWLSGIYCSNVPNFSASVPRVGTFLKLEDRSSDLPSVEWFVAHNIPVWYPISSEILDFARKNPTNPMSKFVPPPEILGMWIQPRLTKLPDLHALSAIRSNAPANPAQSSAPANPAQSNAPPANPMPCNPKSNAPANPRQQADSYVSWQEFFSRRATRNAAILAREGPREREVRLNRERQPPRRKTRVFEWAKGHDFDDDRLYRQLVPQKRHEEFFEMYTGERARYDSFHNEWDLCDEFGPGDSDSDDDDEDYNDTFQDLGPNDGTMDQSTPYQRPASPISVSEPRVWKSPFTDLGGLVQSLAFRFGFVHPLQSRTTVPPILSNEQLTSWRDVLRLAGVSAENEGKYPAQEFWDQNLISFFASLIANQRPPENICDLHRDNRYSILSSELLQDVQVLQSGDFLIPFRDSTWPWTLAVSSIVDVLHICRVQREVKTHDAVARYLIQHGFNFRTLLPLPRIPSTKYVPPVSLIPIRSAGYKFSRKDYSVYEQERDALLATRRARRFLLCGGIAWRLARDSLSLDDALTGPSAVATVYRAGYSAPCNQGGGWWDDDLSFHELALLSGLYICYTGKYLQLCLCSTIKPKEFQGKGDQKSFKSWWPLHTTWEKASSLANYGYWTDYNESWYQTRLKELTMNDHVEPLTETVWKDRLRGSSKKGKPIRANYLKLASKEVNLD
jgi:hypothetical protein